jgi:hypothetical protein
MPKTLVQLLSRTQLERNAKGPEDSGCTHLARRLLDKIELGDDACLSVFDVLEPFFYNMSPMNKRRYFDGIAHALTDNDSDTDELFELFQREGLTGRTWRART